MRRMPILMLWLAAMGPHPATAESKPSDASILELMDVVDAEENMASIDRHIDQMIQASIDQASAGQTLGPEHREILDRMEQRIDRVVDQDTGWQQMKPEILAIYRDTFTQAEIDAMLQFYGSPEGRSVVAKMPTVMRQSMEVARRQIMNVLPKIQQIQEETLQELRNMQ